MQIKVQNGQLPNGFCPPDLQTMLNGFSALQFVEIDTISGVVHSFTPPADHNTAWLKLDGSGNPERLYFFAQGGWLSLHPDFPGKIVLYNQVLPNFTTFDGGDANALSDISGPMWQLANTLLDGTGTQVLGGTGTAQFPVGVGTFVSGDAVGLGATGGEEGHALSLTEMPGHRHFIANADTGSLTSAVLTPTNHMNQKSSQTGADTTDYLLHGTATEATVGLTNQVGAASLGVGDSHNNLPPFYGVYFLQRTRRKFYFVPQ